MIKRRTKTSLSQAPHDCTLLLELTAGGEQRTDVREGGEKGGLINRLTLTVIIISQVTDDCTTAADVEEKTTEGKGTERRGEERSTFILEYYVSQNDMRSTN